MRKPKAQQLSITDDLYRPLVEQVFAYWQEILDHPRSKLDAIKFRCIVTQFEIGYTPDDLKMVIDGVAVDPWGDRYLHDGFNVIFRSENIDKFMRLAEEAHAWQAKRQEKWEQAQKVRETAQQAPTRMPEDAKAFLAQFRKTLTRTT